MYSQKINSILFKKFPALLYGSLILGGFGLFMNLAFDSAVSDSLAAADTMHTHPEEIKGVGPGVSPHYHLVDHALSRLDRGAYGMLEVQGNPVPELLQQIQRETK